MLSLVCDCATCECACALTTESALAIWEYLITLESEVDLFWRKPVTAPSILFIAIRWIMLATAFMQIAPNTEATLDSMPLLHMSDIDTFISNCEALVWAQEVLNFAGYIGTARKQAHFITTISLCSQWYTVFSAIRVFAIWRRSYIWACVVLLLGIVPVATNLVSLPSSALLHSSAYCLLSIKILTLSTVYSCGQVLLSAYLQA